MRLLPTKTGRPEHTLNEYYFRGGNGKETNSTAHTLSNRYLYENIKIKYRL